MSGFSLAQTLSSMHSHTAALEREPTPHQQEAQTLIQVRGGGEEPFTFLSRTLDRIRTLILELPAEARPKVEIEARFGIFAHRGRGEDERMFPACPGAGAVEIGGNAEGGPQTRFFSGVTRGAFEEMKATVAGLGGGTIEASHLHEIVYLYADKRRIRCEVPKNGKLPSGVTPTGILESKRKLIEVNVALPAAPYDLRLTVAVENEENATQTVVTGWESRRAKIRTSYKDPLGNATLGPWSLDFTCVTTMDSEGDGAGGPGLSASSSRGAAAAPSWEEESTEVEMELGAEVMVGWLETAGEEADKETSRLASRLLDTIKRLNPLERSSPGNILVPILMDRSGGGGGGASIQDALKQRCVAVLQAAGGGGGGRNVKFPGTMPVNLCRKDVATVQQGGYWLAEKTDGVRYLLFVMGPGLGGTQQQTSYLMDRSMAMYTFPGADGLGHVLPAGTILDGELVFNRLTSSYLFLVFDALFWGMDPLVALPFSQRLLAIHQRVMPAYENGKAKGLLPPGKHLPIVGKKFYRRTHIARLFDRVSEEEGHRVYRDEDCITSYLHYLGLTGGKKKGDSGEAAAASAPPPRAWQPRECLARYYHKTDGIVFQPDRHYQCSTDIHFFKWKWMDTVTIDFAVVPTPYKVTCGAGAAGSLDLTRQVKLEPLDIMRMRADMNAARCRIAELGFSIEAGYWTYKMLRPDKTDPNYFTTVCTTMLELAEGIEEEELQYRMMVAHPAQDDWAQQVGKMRKAAVVWRRGELEGGAGGGDGSKKKL